MRRRAPTCLLSFAVLTFAVLAAFGTPAPARGAVDLRICGKVTAYVPATALTTGLLTVGGVPLVIATDTSLSSRIQTGANLCFALDLNASGRITDATVTANATSTVHICGVVTSLARADANSQGSLTIRGIRFVLGVGSTLPAHVTEGANLCLRLTLDGFGHVRGASAQVNATSAVDVCGVLTAYARADSNSTGSLTIGGRTFTTAIGSSLPAAVRAGAELCAHLTLNALGQVQGGNVLVNATSTVRACGAVTALVRATSASSGRMAIEGRSFVLAAGSKLPASVAVGKDLCFTLTLNAFGQVQDATVQLDVHSTLEVCGQVTGVVASTSSTGGSLAIDDTTHVVRAGADLDTGIKAGAFLRLRLETDLFGRVAEATVLRLGASLADACRGGEAPRPSGEPGPSDEPGPSGETEPTGEVKPSIEVNPSGDPDPSDGPDAVAGDDDRDDCIPDGGAATRSGIEQPDQGGIIPDTASVGRVASVVAFSAVPFALLLLGLATWAVQRRLRRVIPGLDLEEVRP